MLENFKYTAPAEKFEAYKQLILQNHDVFASNKFDLGFSDAVSHKINMKDNLPIYVKQFCVPDAHQQTLLEHVNEWKTKQVFISIQLAHFCVPKKGGGLRIVQDCREINKHSFEDKYAIRDVQECIDTIGVANSKVFQHLTWPAVFGSKILILIQEILQHLLFHS